MPTLRVFDYWIGDGQYESYAEREREIPMDNLFDEILSVVPWEHWGILMCDKPIENTRYVLYEMPEQTPQDCVKELVLKSVSSNDCLLLYRTICLRDQHIRQTENKRTQKRGEVYIKVLVNNTKQEIENERQIFNATFIKNEAGESLDFGCLHSIPHSVISERTPDALFDILNAELAFEYWESLDVVAISLPDGKKTIHDRKIQDMDAQLLQRYKFPLESPTDHFYSKRDDQDVNHVKRKLSELMNAFRDDGQDLLTACWWMFVITQCGDCSHQKSTEEAPAAPVKVLGSRYRLNPYCVSTIY
jgi:hypothetical protein